MLVMCIVDMCMSVLFVSLGLISEWCVSVMLWFCCVVLISVFVLLKWGVCVDLVRLSCVVWNYGFYGCVGWCSSVVWMRLVGVCGVMLL